jgi:asparagine synthase (glutamine-hydrolysing)
MPGIVGLISSMPRNLAEQKLLQMVSAIRHEPFYSIGTWIDESVGVYVGWAALNQSFCDNMPIHNERGDVVLAFSGEEFPAPDTVRRLRDAGHAVEANGPSYLVHLYEDDPDGFPKGLNGRFHGLLIDRGRQRALIFNDRYGMHKVYFHRSEDAFYFAGEAKALLAVCPALRKIDMRALGEFVACGCVLGNSTLFTGISILPPASAWRFQNASEVSEHTYFRPEQWEQQEPMQSDEYYRQLRNVFSQNLPRYLDGRQKIGMSLSGGLDTRAVVAWQHLLPGSLPCYTYGGTFRDCRDVIVSKQVAKVCTQPHQVITVGREFLERFHDYAERTIFLSDATVDVLRCPDLYVSEKAREVAPVRLTGLYGDEVLRLARAFKPTTLAPELFHPDFRLHISNAQGTYRRAAQVHPLTFSAFRQAPWFHQGILSLEESQLTVRTPFLDNDLIRTAFRAPNSASTNNKLRVHLIRDGNPSLTRIPSDRGAAGLGSLTRLFYSLLWGLTFKTEYAYDYGMPQWLARIDHTLLPLRIERLFLGRHKIFHFRVWYRDTLSQYLRDMLMSSKSLSRPYLQRSQVERVVNSHLRGTRNYTSEIHKLLTLELLHCLFID